MNKLKLGLAALITAAALSSCGDAASDAIVAAAGNTPIKPPDGKSETNIVVTFKNGWEGAAQGELQDDPYTKDVPVNKTLSPSTVNAVVDTAEKNAYDEAYAVWKAINDAWVKYEKDREEAQNSGINPPPPPNESLPPEPVPPVATIPYFPGDEYLYNNEPQKAGEAPEWDYHTLTGWKIEGGEEATLNTPVTGNITVTAEWIDAPGKPYYTVTFNRNAGTGVFEKRIATPAKTLYETTAVEAGEGLVARTIPADEEGEEATTVYFTEDGSADNLKEDGLILYEDYKLASSYQAGGGDVTQEPLVPEFTREHYTSAGWEDISGNDVTPDANYKFEGDTQLYQSWEANKFTVKFELNGKTLKSTPSEITNGISGVNEALSAEGGLAKAKQTLPAITEKVKVGEGEGAITYEFVNWADKAEGGNVINASSPLFPKEEGSTEVTLYAQWRVEGVAQYVFNYNGSSGGADGSAQTWKVPVSGVYTIEAWGAGGNGGGQGGYIGGNITLTAGQTLYIYVGGMGGPSVANQGWRTQFGGWNGGGPSGGTSGDGVTKGGGGHGAADVRTVSGAWDNADSLASRIIVAGGGGGPGTNGYAGNGGLGKAAGGKGGNDNESEVVSAGGGGLTSGGQPSAAITNVTAGSLGKGGNGGQKHRGGGGGGSGYYGGSGGSTIIPEYVSGGGGGSSWAQTEDGSDLKFTQVVPQQEVAGGGSNEGHGKVTITFVSTD
jgi:hypothetical protein